jgi:hypothetical protein
VVLGILVGSMIRRVLPAMATTLALLTAVRIVIAVLVRRHYMSALSKPVSLSTNNLPTGAWLLSITRRGLYIYQPADRFWIFQGIETGIFIVFTAGLVALAYRMVVSRDA